MVREFLLNLKEKQKAEEVEEALDDEGESVDSLSDLTESNEEIGDEMPASDSSTDQRLSEGQLAETMMTKSSRNKFVWTKRAVRIVMRRYGR